MGSSEADAFTDAFTIRDVAQNISACRVGGSWPNVYTTRRSMPPPQKFRPGFRPGVK